MRPPSPRFRQPDSAVGAPPRVERPAECADTEQVPAALRDRAPRRGQRAAGALAVYGLLGAGLGLVFTKSQVVSWFRIYEMFRFESFHLYGIIGSAVVTAAVSVWLIKRFGVTTVHGEPIVLSPKAWGGGRIPGARYWMGGITFGVGWALLGACPGPLVALLAAA